ncbi:HlyD family efflux transporter periplasmic adaptor subunit [Streptacidiphilus carbonis]|uniref:HlyD family efflux transporter periplasmic adaptor subunit n=1 Tax=Streptacidiphilus carbonis TaxID=105422 RepID=UPI0005AA4841|nr:HlyD family efflux transporter periplasmic adaptor subunit [Streptacidiphilus carbonis]
MQFRKKALAKQQSSEELDIPVRLARPQGRLVLLATAAVVAAACFWAVTGTVSSKLSAAGILIHAEGSYTLQSPVAGQVVAVSANVGDTLAGGAPLLSVSTGTGSGQKVQTVRTVAAGRLTTLVAKLGTVVQAGSELATVERVTSPSEPLVAVLYVSAGSAATIPAGAAVDLTVQSVPAQQYGVLRGHVLAVGRVPETQQQISDYLGSGPLAQAFSAQGEPVAVVVQLERSGSTRSGYAWSSTQGPPYPVESTTLVGSAVHLGTQHPIDWLLP